MRKGERLYNFLCDKEIETQDWGSPSEIDAAEGWGRLNYLNEISDEEFDRIANPATEEKCGICRRPRKYCVCFDPKYLSVTK